MPRTEQSPLLSLLQYSKVVQCRQVGAGSMETYNQLIEVSRSSLGFELGDLVDVAGWGIVPCVSKIDTLGGGGGAIGKFWGIVPGVYKIYTLERFRVQG